jgi:hypothetical protein
VSPDDLDDFARQSLCDNKLAAMELESGQSLPAQTVIHLAGQAEALFILVSLHAKSFDLIKQHRILWQKGAEFFEEVLSVWRSVPSNGKLLSAHLQMLTQLCELSRDRVQFYTLGDERGDYQQRKVD